MWGLILVLLQVVWTPDAVDHQLLMAEQVVVGRVKTTTAEAARSPFGDQLIVTRVQVAVEETLKGSPASILETVVEGGTLDGITMGVSETRVPKVNERVMVFKRGNRFAKGRDVQLLDDSPESNEFLQTVRARAKKK